MTHLNLRSLARPEAQRLIDATLEPLMSYGVQWDENNTSPVLSRIGNMDMHRTLPIQSRMVRCLLSDSGQETLLNPNNSLLLATGGSADLSGAAGQWMVRIPEFWYKTESEGSIRRIRLALQPYAGYRHFRQAYVSAAEACLHRPTNRLSAVVNTHVDFRGGNNNAAWDAQANTLLGMPVTNAGRPTMRTWARNRGSRWQILPYHVYNAIRILYFVEYANLNSQLAFNAALTADGYRQGGLGDGVTAVNGTNWGTFNSTNPLVPCGHTADQGNNTSVKNYTIVGFTGGNISVPVPSYRGIANPFGHIWHHTDGCLFRVEANPGVSEFFATEDPSKFSDTDTALMERRGQVARSTGWIRRIIFGPTADFVASEIGAASTTHYCDHFWVAIPATGFQLYTLLLGGDASDGALAGFSVARSDYSPAFASATLGSRLCFLP